MKENLTESKAFELVVCALASEYSKVSDPAMDCFKMALQVESFHGSPSVRVIADWSQNDKYHRVEGCRFRLEDFVKYKFPVDLTHLLRDVSRAVEDKRNSLKNENGLHKAHTP